MSTSQENLPYLTPTAIIDSDHQSRAWIKRFEETGGQSLSDFDREEIMRGEAFN